MVPVLLADPCSYCGATAGTVDHIRAMSQGGDSEVDNLTASCRSCNASKNSRSLLIFLTQRII